MCHRLVSDTMRNARGGPIRQRKVRRRRQTGCGMQVEALADYDLRKEAEVPVDDLSRGEPQREPEVVEKKDS